MSIATVLTTINVETDPNVLRKMQRAIRERLDVLAQINAADIGAGDVIQFGANIRPTYCRGLLATVVKANDKSVTVRCPNNHAYGRFAGSGGVRVPVGLIARKVSADEAAAHKAKYAPQPERPRVTNGTVAALPAALKEQFLQLASQLSPENLTCDGELSRAAVANRRKSLQRQWNALEQRIGRKVTESEVWAA